MELANQVTLKALARAASPRMKNKIVGYCATGVSESLKDAGYTYEGGRPRVAHGIINNQAYDYSSSEWVAGTTVG